MSLPHSPETRIIYLAFDNTPEHTALLVPAPSHMPREGVHQLPLRAYILPFLTPDESAHFIGALDSTKNHWVI